MERVAQYLDHLDDLVGIFGLIGERIRNILLPSALVLLTATAPGAIALAAAEPPLALATAVMLSVFLLYRSVTRPIYVDRDSA